ncbi:MAG: DUF1559 domain-containing protein [Pirellulaceae bacterium]
MRRPPSSLHESQPGFTLIELLVVVAITGLLVALLLPAVQAVRESSRKVRCQNNLRQISVAAQNFESAFRFLPSNGWGFQWIADPSRGYGKHQPGGWIFHIAQFCELQLPTSTSGDPVQDFDIRTQLSTTPFTLMSCPSRPGQPLSLASRTPSPINAAFRAMVPKTDYAANEGDYMTGTLGGPNSLAEGDDPSYPWVSRKNATGVVFQRSQISFGQITDGVSNTILCGEKYVSSDEYFTANDLGHDQSLYSGVDLDLNRWTIEPPVRDSSESAVTRFGSAHASGAFMTMCDGSVRLVSYAIEPLAFQRLGNRHDGHE